MKCTDYYKLLEQIRQHEHRELKLALKPYGGEYTFNDDDRPKISVTSDYGSYDVQVKSINVHGISGYDELAGEDVEVRINDIITGQIGYIIESIPETDFVKNVTIPFTFK